MRYQMPELDLAAVLEADLKFLLQNPQVIVTLFGPYCIYSSPLMHDLYVPIICSPNKSKIN